MRWDEMFADLEGRLAAEEVAERRLEVADRTRRERAAVGLADRLVESIGRLLSLRLEGGADMSGELAEVGQDWLLLDQGGTATVVPLSRISLVEGVGRWSDARPARSRRRYGIGVLLRELARDRSVVRVLLVGEGALEGRVAAVGADHLDLVRDGGDLVGRRGAREAGITVPYAAVVAVVYR